MKFEPKSKEELEKANDKFAPFPDGIYDCEVLDAEDTVSKAGNDMIAVKLCVYNGEQNRFVNDWLMAKLEYKLRHAAETFGLLDKYEKGELEGIDFQGKTGKVKIKIQKSEGYKDKNAVVDYIPSMDEAALKNHGMSKPSKKGADDLDDEIPF